jgi:hypothetical protein
MKTSSLMFAAFAALVLLAGCGLQEGDSPVTPPDTVSDSGSPTDTDAGVTTTTNAGTTGTDAGTAPTTDAGTTGTDAGTTTPANDPAPFRFYPGFVIDVHKKYVSGSLCAELRGNLPGMSWSAGPFVQDRDLAGNYDGWLGTAYAAPAGTYELSYVDRNCAGETGTEGTFAQFGDLAVNGQMSRIKAEDRAFLYCNQYNPAANSCVCSTFTDPVLRNKCVTEPGCKGRVTFDGSGNPTPAGNMRDFAAGPNTGCN